VPESASDGSRVADLDVRRNAAARTEPCSCRDCDHFTEITPGSILSVEPRLGICLDDPHAVALLDLREHLALVLDQDIGVDRGLAIDRQIQLPRPEACRNLSVVRRRQAAPQVPTERDPLPRGETRRGVGHIRRQEHQR
jgi:hypothetical protein